MALFSSTQRRRAIMAGHDLDAFVLIKEPPSQSPTPLKISAAHQVSSLVVTALTTAAGKQCSNGHGWPALMTLEQSLGQVLTDLPAPLKEDLLKVVREL